MPGVAFHSFFWQTLPPEIPNPAVGGSASGGFVPWQTTVTVVSMLCLAARVSWSAR